MLLQCVIFPTNGFSVLSRKIWRGLSNEKKVHYILSVVYETNTAFQDVWYAFNGQMVILYGVWNTEDVQG